MVVYIISMQSFSNIGSNVLDNSGMIKHQELVQSVGPSSKGMFQKHQASLENMFAQVRRKAYEFFHFLFLLILKCKFANY